MFVSNATFSIDAIESMRIFIPHIDVSNYNRENCVQGISKTWHAFQDAFLNMT